MKLSSHIITLNLPQITYFKEFEKRFNSEELEYRGEVEKKDNSFTHAFGTKLEFDYYVTYLEVKLCRKWFSLIENGTYGDSLPPFDQGQIEEIINTLKD
jgi:hypothetical protein